MVVWHPNSIDTNLGKLREMVRDRGAGVLQSMVLQRVRHDLATEQQQWLDDVEHLLTSLLTISLQKCLFKSCV